MPAITENFVCNAITRGDEGFFWDAKLKGFAVRILSGGRAGYYVKYRVNGRVRKHRIGPVPPFTAYLARKRAEEILAAARLGRDLVEEMTRPKSPYGGHTVAELAERHQEIHRPPQITPHSFKMYRSAWTKYIVPQLGHRLVAEITREDVQAFHASIPLHTAANKCVRVLKLAFRVCEEWTPPWRPEHSNPCKGLRQNREYYRDRILTEEELPRFLRTLFDMKREGQADPQVAACILLLLLTGLRRQEWAAAKWDQVDFDRKALRLPRTKTGPRVVTLSDRAIEILRDLREEVGTEWVVPNRSQTGPADFRVTWAKLMKRAGIENFRVHDLRHTAASYAHVIGGLTPHQVGEMLGHTSLQHTSRYLNLTDTMRRDGAEKATSAILRLASVAPAPPEAPADDSTRIRPSAPGSTP